jgi:tRNA G18 (ribose-2'-O)-methylase SpoU
LPDAQAFLDRARRTSLRTVAAVSRGGAAPRDVPRDRPVALCIGSEAQGLSPAVLARIEHRATIPMGSPIDSYSVNAAAAILLWELGPSSGGA